MKRARWLRSVCPVLATAALIALGSSACAAAPALADVEPSDGITQVEGPLAAWPAPLDGTAQAATVMRPILSPEADPYPPQGSKGFGRVKPSEIFYGGDPAGLVCDIHWTRWGGRSARGSGTGWYVRDGQGVSQGHWARATVVASSLGSWKGRPAYRQLTWSFTHNGRDHERPCGAKSKPKRKLYSCSPVHRRIVYEGGPINFFGPLDRTRNVSCSTARAMSRYIVSHEVETSFLWRGSRWTTALARPEGNAGPTIYTLSTRGRAKIIKVTIAVPVG